MNRGVRIYISAVGGALLSLLPIGRALAQTSAAEESPRPQVDVSDVLRKVWVGFELGPVVPFRLDSTTFPQALSTGTQVDAHLGWSHVAREGGDPAFSALATVGFTRFGQSADVSGGDTGALAPVPVVTKISTPTLVDVGLSGRWYPRADLHLAIIGGVAFTFYSLVRIREMDASSGVLLRQRDVDERYGGLGTVGVGYEPLCSGAPAPRDGSSTKQTGGGRAHGDDAEAGSGPCLTLSLSVGVRHASASTFLTVPLMLGVRF